MLYVMPDIHGNLARFNSIMEQIKMTDDDYLIVLGDVIDRFPDGLEILQKLFKMKNCSVLLGNHELMMFQALWAPATEADLKLWYKNGGEVTHNAWKKLSLREQVDIIYELKKCPISSEVTVNDKRYCLVHSCPPELFDPKTSKHPCADFHAVWQRILPDDKMPEGKTVIFGHTPTFVYQPIKPMALWSGEQKIAIDCGAGYDKHGRLCCLRLDDMKVFYSKEEE